MAVFTNGTLSNKPVALFDFMRNVTGNHGTKYMPSTTLGEIQKAMTELKDEIENIKNSYRAVKEASNVMVEELKSVDEIMPLIQKCLGDKYTEEDKNKVTVFVEDYLDVA
jgi:hypothetical protein